MVTVKDLDARQPSWLHDFIQRKAGPPELIELAQMKLDSLSMDEEVGTFITTRDDGRAAAAWSARRRELIKACWVAERDGYRRTDG